MRNVTICAPFRDSGVNVSYFMHGVYALDYPRQQLRIIAVEGDSQDDTRPMLSTWYAYDRRVNLLTCDTGAPRYGSIVHPKRFATLARVFNMALDAVDLEWSDYVLFTPSDIRFDSDVLSRLIAHGKDMIAPFFYGNDGLFHDTWGFTRAGREFDKFSREDAPARYGDTPLAMDTVGGMVLIDAAVLRAGCRYTTEEVDRGLCKTARERGYRVWADPSLSVVHL